MQNELIDLVIDADLAGRMIRDVLYQRLHMSRKIVRKLVEGQGILLNEQNTWLSMRLQEGDRLRLVLPAEESEDILPEPIPYTCVYEDEDVLVVDKQAGLIVHPTLGHWTGTLANGIVYDWKQRGIVARFRPVHRIDQWTSGLIVIAKNHYALKLLAEQMMARTIERSYVAIVHGVMQQDAGWIDMPIGRHKDDRRVRVVTRLDDPEGQSAQTEYRVRERLQHHGALVELKLHTGRTHQIRVHMQRIGHSLYGDPMYGSLDAEDLQDKKDGPFSGERQGTGITRQALHAQSLGFVHPRTGEFMRFHSPLPADMAELLQVLREEEGR